MKSNLKGHKLLGANPSRNLLIWKVIVKYPEVPFMRTFYTFIDVQFARVSNLLTKVNPVRGTFLRDPPSIFADGDRDVAGDRAIGDTARFPMLLVDPMI